MGSANKVTGEHTRRQLIGQLLLVGLRSNHARAGTIIRPDAQRHRTALGGCFRRGADAAAQLFCDTKRRDTTRQSVDHRCRSVANATSACVCVCVCVCVVGVANTHDQVRD